MTLPNSVIPSEVEGHCVMRMHKYWTVFLVSAMVTLAGTVTMLFACSMSYSEAEVGNNFEVMVRDRGNPIEGIEVRISRSIEKPDFHFETVASLKTDANGIVRFKGIKSGRYSIAAIHADIEGTTAYLKVVSAHATVRMSMDWPQSKVFKVQTISGIFNARFFRDTGKGTVLDIANKQEGLFANQPLSVTRAYSAQPIASTTTDDRGHFSFNSLEPGLYILHVEELATQKTRHDFDIKGNIFIEVSPNANDHELPILQLNESSCGLDYKTMESNALNAQTH